MPASRWVRILSASHRRQPIGVVIGVVDLPLWSHFLCEPIQAVIGSGDRGRDGATRILLLHLCDPIAHVIRVVRGCAVVEGGLRSSV